MRISSVRAASRGRAAFPLLLVNDVVWWRLRPRLRVASDVLPAAIRPNLSSTPPCALVVCGDVTAAGLELPQLFIGLMISENYEAPRLSWGSRRESGADA